VVFLGLTRFPGLPRIGRRHSLGRAGTLNIAGGRQRVLREATRRGRRRLGVFLAILVLAAGCTPEKQKELKAGEKSIILPGTVLPLQDAEVGSPLSGLVSHVLVEPGQRVQATQVVVRIDPTPYRAETSKAEAALAMARANLARARAGASDAELAEARAEVERVKQELDRQRRLAALPTHAADYERAGIILDNAKARLERLYALFARRLASRPELESAQNEYADAWQRHQAALDALEGREAVRDSDVRIAEARYSASRARLEGLEAGGGKEERIASARAQVRQAEADVTRARYNQEQTNVVAPIGGIVTEVKASVGGKVDERSPLVSITNIDRVQVKADLSPGLLPHVRPGQPATVTINTVPPTVVPATIQKIQPVADPKTQSLGLTIVVANPGLKFQPGFTARVEIPVGPPPAGAPKQ
jgi:multidrug resistance efflux pump